MSYKFNLVPLPVQRIDTIHRLIETDIPCPSSIPYMEMLIKNEPLSMNNQLPILWDRADNFNVRDLDGNKFIDLTSTIFVANMGHGIGKNAIIESAQKSLINAYYYPTIERAKFTNYLLNKVVNNPKFDKVLLLSTGSEAVEAALKMVRIYSKKLYENPDFIAPYDQCIIAGFENAFHGKTLGSQIVGGKPKEQKWYENDITSNTLRLPFPYPWILNDMEMTGAEFFHHSIKKFHFDQVVQLRAIIFEPYQGWCAVFLPQDYAEEMYKWCKKNKTLLISDEIQSGFGRTGKLFGYQHYENLEVDIIVCGKAISGGLPVSAVIANSELFGDDESLNSTHGGNPVALAGALENLKKLMADGENDINLIERSETLGNVMNDFLTQWLKHEELVINVYCKGLLASVFLKSPTTSISDNDFVDMVIERAYQKGVISIRTGSGTLKIGPPLTIAPSALLEALLVYKECVIELKKKLRE